VFRVDDPVGRHQTTYGRSKGEGERIARAFQADGHPVVTIYPGGVYGPDDPVLGDGAKGLRDRLRFGWPITTGGSSCVDVRDVASIVAAACTPGRGPRRYMAGGHFLRWAEEADVCERLTGRPVRRVRVSPPALRAAGRFLDFAKRFLSIGYPLTAEAASFITEMVPADCGPTTVDLGVRFRPPAETYADAIRWLHAAGHLDARLAGFLAR